MKIGYHISISGGLTKCAQTIKEQKLSSVQIFPGSPRSYYPSTHSEDALESFRNLKIPKFVHINYFVNPASDNKNNLPSLEQNLLFCDSIEANGLVVHMGSNKDTKKGLELTKKNITEAYEKSGAKTKILLETTAEGGNKLKLPLIIDFIKQNPELNVGMCVDTCHLFSAGYKSKEIVEVIEQYHQYIDCIHLNNPSPNVEIGKHKDQHDISLFDISGKFTKKEIDNFISISSLYKIPLILETGNQLNDFNFIIENYQNF
jgi:deoxyribonuclease IV